jgi:TatD DNase family protein
VIELFDSHCHLTDAAFRDDREAVLHRAREAGVTGVVTIASSVADAQAAADLARIHDGLWCTAGIHPHEAGSADAGALQRVRELATAPDVVGIGETGLDYHYDHSPRKTQRDLFRAHLELGAELDLPVIVHSREADEDIAAALNDAPPGVRGVLHCFAGGLRAFETAMERDWYVSFSGIASFKSFGAVELLREVPPSRLLVETDAPYLAPVPRRGKRNEPAFVRHVAEAVAAHLGRDVGWVAQETSENARRFYGLAAGSTSGKG